MKKTTLRDLAIFGGKPAFKKPLHVGRPNIGNRNMLMKNINAILDNRVLTNNGYYVRDFESHICRKLNVRHCISTCNGTLALMLAVRALDLNGEVIMPSMTFIATAHSLAWHGITPVFSDINPDTLCIDPAQVKKLITPKTSGIIGVHLFGTPCDVDALTDLAKKHNLKLMFDAAHAFACSHNGKMIGSFGDAEVFSFHATKIINTFEGGAITTNNDDLAARLRLMRNFGFLGLDNVTTLGINAKMPEVNATMGLSSLTKLNMFIKTNIRNHNLYKKEFLTIPGIKLRERNLSEENNFHYIIAEVDESVTGISRDRLLNILHTENIYARRYFHPGCHNMEPYKSKNVSRSGNLNITENILTRILVLPNGTAIGKKEINTICTAIRLAVKYSDDISCDLTPIKLEPYAA